MTTALITGASGFTGRFLSQELTRSGYDVIHLSSRPLPDDVSGKTYTCDLLDRDGLISVFSQVRPDVVIHLAAIAFVAHGDVDAIYRTNVVGTRNLLEAISRSGHIPRSILLASSANVYGNTEAEFLDETMSPAPANDYAVSKLAMEYMARLWFDQLPITIVRPFNYTGVGQAVNFLIPKIVDHFKRRLPVLELGNLDVIRDFSDVRSVVSRYRLLLESDVRGETFNVCSGQGHTLMEVIDIMEKLSGYRPEIRVNPAFVRANEVRRLIGSRAKLDAAIGSVPDIALENTLHWMLSGS